MTSVACGPGLSSLRRLLRAVERGCGVAGILVATATVVASVEEVNTGMHYGSLAQTPSASLGRVLVTFLALLAIMAATVKVYDLRRKRMAASIALQAQLSDAVFRDAVLVQLSVTPTVHVPFWTGSPAKITISGVIQSEARRGVVKRIFEQEAFRIRPDFHIEDRLIVRRQTHAT
jgi:hypothetical protein